MTGIAQDSDSGLPRRWPIITARVGACKHAVSEIRRVALSSALLASWPWAAWCEDLRAVNVHNELQTAAMSGTEAEVWRTVEEWNAAFAANDVARYFSYIDPAIIVLTPSNPYRVEGAGDDRAEFSFGLERGYSRVAYFEEVAPVVRVYGDVAVVTYFNRGLYGQESGGQMIYLKETNVLRRVDGRWRIVHIHVSK